MKSSTNSTPKGLLFFLKDQANVDKLLKLLRKIGIDPVCYPDLEQNSGIPVYVIHPSCLDDALQRITDTSGRRSNENAPGRPRADVTAETIAKAYYETGLPITQIMELYQISRSTVHRRLNEAAVKGLHTRDYRRSVPPTA